MTSRPINKSTSRRVNRSVRDASRRRPVDWLTCLPLVMVLCVFAEGTYAQEAASQQFAAAVDLSPLGRVAIQDDGRLKGFDSFAASIMRYVSGPHEIFDQSPTFTYIDLILRPERYVDVPLIYVKMKPVRQQIADALKTVPTEDVMPARDRAARVDAFMDSGLISQRLISTPEVVALLDRLSADLIRTAKPVNAIKTALALSDPDRLAIMWRIVPPGTDDLDTPWLSLSELHMPEEMTGPLAIEPERRAELIGIWQRLRDGWQSENAGVVDEAAADLAAALPAINPDLYPKAQRGGWPWNISEGFAGWLTSALLLALAGFGAIVGHIRNWKGLRNTSFMLALLIGGLAAGAMVMGQSDALALESWYFRARNMTWVWVFYLLAIIPLLLSLVYRWPGARWIGLGLFIVAFGFHSFALLLRWYVADRWPNSNMFEAVTTSAWLAGAAALLIEMTAGRTRMRNTFALGSAAGSMVALMAAYFLPLSLDASISNRMPVLHDIWLYIHTNVIIFSYALIFMAGVSAVLYLINRGILVARRRDGRDEFARVGGAGSLIITTPQGGAMMSAPRTSLGQVLDGTTMVLMELSFITLWAGLVMGAIWADHSWGRPWGWDPKEVFALNTFIVLAILVHTRLRSRDKGLWTAILAIAGVGVMLFNWIMINFVITGLHSYA